jgi:hypothetical protein
MNPWVDDLDSAERVREARRIFAGLHHQIEEVDVSVCVESQAARRAARRSQSDRHREGSAGGHWARPDSDVLGIELWRRC